MTEQTQSPLSPVPTHILLSPVDVDKLRELYNWIEVFWLTGNPISPGSLGQMLDLIPPLPEIIPPDEQLMLVVFDEIPF